MRINHNIAALNTHRQLNSATTAQSKSMEKLASGLRINKAGDDAAGLAISEKMRGQIRGLDQASANAQDGISLIATAEGALGETHSILQRMRELSVQSSNDTATDADRSEIQKEVSQLKDEIGRIANTTEFNTKKLLNGDLEKSKQAQGTKLQSTELTVGATAASVAANANYNAYTIDDSNNKLSITANGTSVDINIAQGTYTEAELLTAVDAAFTNAGTVNGTDLTQVASSVNGGKLTLTTAATAGQDIVIAAETAGEANKFFGFTASETLAEGNGGTAEADANVILSANALNITEGSNDSLTITLGDGTAQTIDITASSDAYSKKQVVDMINTAIQGNANLKDKVTVEQDADGNVVLGAKGGLSISVANTALSADLGLTTGGAATTVTDTATTLISNLQDKEGNSFGLKVGDEINISGNINGSAVSTNNTFTVAADSNVQDLMDQIETAFGLDAGSVTLDSKGQVQIAGKDGSAQALSNIKLSVEDRALFNNKFSAMEETQDAQDTHINSSLSMHIGANEGQTMKVDINEMSVKSLALTSVDVSTQEGAETAITVIQNALDSVSTERSKLGSFQNRLEHTINNLGTSSENLTAAESRIRDVDYALAA